MHKNEKCIKSKEIIKHWVVGTLDGENKISHSRFICKWLIFCDPRGIQTPNLLIRSQLLYSVELWGPFE
jgi:hypothetical protein